MTMTVIDAVRLEREDLARVLKKHTGIRKIVEDLYPDNAHFIYELLQNAEDTHATYAQFVLTEKSLAFEHDGRPFEPRDIEAITDIGEGTKAGDDDKIGRFGVGFKAVFAYSETPHIWSPTFSFKISELVLPNLLDQRPDLGNKTRFEFPFDNPKKTSATAFAEIKAGLNELAETTLLFLTHLESISWRIGEASSGDVLRMRHSDCHFEVLKQIVGATTSSSHFLKFDRPVEGLEKQRVATAFALDFLPGVDQFDMKKSVSGQFRIVPVAGRVAVFFPAEKETSGLRFHLHAPFVPELSRASIKETPANQPLFQQVASLTGAALHRIRDLGLLTADFLAVLPNMQDSLPDRYKNIRESIFREMNSEALTPTYTKGHAPAKQLLQAKTALKDLLAPEDLEFLVEYEDEFPYQWAISATQKNNYVDRFLEGLGIQDWGTEEFCELLKSKTAEDCDFDLETFEFGPDKQFMDWLAGKSLEWHQKLYAVLYCELSPSDDFSLILGSRIVRLDSGEYLEGGHCFFSGDDVDHDDGLPRVDKAVYASGKSKLQQENAKKFLEWVGVREVGEAEQIEALLEQRYQLKNFSPRKKDLKRFVALTENEPHSSRIFANYFIFEGDDGKWHRPNEIYLDRPYSDSGLSAYYDVIGLAKRPLAQSYLHAEVSVKRVAKFAAAVGAQMRLEILSADCQDNPQYAYLQAVKGDRYSSPIDSDFSLDGIRAMLSHPTLPISRLIWGTMEKLPSIPNYLIATYRKSAQWGARTADSQLVHHLRDAAWVPQGDSKFVRPSEANRDLLPEGFAFDVGWPWLKAIHFGEDEARRTEVRKLRQSQAESLGFADPEALDRAQQFAQLPTEEQRRLLAEWEKKRGFELPEHEASNAKRRSDRVGKKALEAPDQEFEIRSRSVPIGRDEIKQQAAQYLRQQYTNADGVMICQICESSLPFKLDNGADYFEKVWFLTDLQKQHYQNYLALCPNHAAMFQYANGCGDELMAFFAAMDGNHLDIVLAQNNESIYFTTIHITDLNAVIESEFKHKEADEL